MLFVRHGYNRERCTQNLLTVDIPIIVFVGKRSRLTELSRELKALVLSVKKDCLLQVNQNSFPLPTLSAAP